MPESQLFRLLDGVSATGEWPGHHAAEPSDEFAPSKANAHLPLPSQ
jgi:hypothetical protein